MRKQLEKQNNIRSSFTGIFERFGTKKNYHGFPEKTVLIKNIKDSGNNVVCNHLCFNYTKQFEFLGDLKQGSIIKFDARVKEYVKGYINHREFIDERTIDYKLSYPTKISVVKRGNND